MSSANRIVSLLEQMVWGEAPLTQKELADAAGLSSSTASYILGDLTRLGFVDVVDRRYLPGPRLVALSHRISERRDLRQRMRPALERIAAETTETVTLSVERGATATLAGEMYVTDYIDSTQPVRFVVGLPGPRPIYPLASGVVLLAHSGRTSSAIAPELLVRHTSKTLVDPDAIDRELARIRKRGYAAQIDQRVEGMMSIAAPVLDGAAAAIASVSVYGPTQRMRPNTRDIAAKLVSALRAVDGI